MRECRASVLLPYRVDDVFALVEDVESYASFLPWCIQAEIIERDNETITARMRVRVRNYEEDLVTRNRASGIETIEITMVTGPFSDFHALWSFVDLSAGCRVTLELKFNFKNRLLDTLATRLINKATNRVVDAFADRARATLTPC